MIEDKLPKKDITTIFYAKLFALAILRVPASDEAE